VKHFLAVLADRAPGASVEVRVPPYAAVQAVAGVRHTRGTPPAVVELDADTWIALATGGLSWSDAERDGRDGPDNLRHNAPSERDPRRPDLVAFRFLLVHGRF